MYSRFNATGTYNIALQVVSNTSEHYSYWKPTTLQSAFLLAHQHDAHMSHVAHMWETAMAEYLTGKAGFDSRAEPTYIHRERIKVSCIVDSTFETAMQQSLDRVVPM